MDENMSSDFDDQVNFTNDNENDSPECSSPTAQSYNTQYIEQASNSASVGYILGLQEKKRMSKRNLFKPSFYVEGEDDTSVEESSSAAIENVDRDFFSTPYGKSYFEISQENYYTTPPTVTFPKFNPVEGSPTMQPEQKPTLSNPSPQYNFFNLNQKTEPVIDSLNSQLQPVVTKLSPEEEQGQENLKHLRKKALVNMCRVLNDGHKNPWQFASASLDGVPKPIYGKFIIQSNLQKYNQYIHSIQSGSIRQFHQKPKTASLPTSPKLERLCPLVKGRNEKSETNVFEIIQNNRKSAAQEVSIEKQFDSLPLNSDSDKCTKISCTSASEAEIQESQSVFLQRTPIASGSCGRRTSRNSSLQAECLNDSTSSCRPASPDVQFPTDKDFGNVSPIRGSESIQLFSSSPKLGWSTPGKTGDQSPIITSSFNQDDFELQKSPSGNSDTQASDLSEHNLDDLIPILTILSKSESLRESNLKNSPPPGFGELTRSRVNQYLGHQQYDSSLYNSGDLMIESLDLSEEANKTFGKLVDIEISVPEPAIDSCDAPQKAAELKEWVEGILHKLELDQIDRNISIDPENISTVEVDVKAEESRLVEVYQKENDGILVFEPSENSVFVPVQDANKSVLIPELEDSIDIVAERREKVGVAEMEGGAIIAGIAAKIEETEILSELQNIVAELQIDVGCEAKQQLDAQIAVEQNLNAEIVAGQFVGIVIEAQEDVGELQIDDRPVAEEQVEVKIVAEQEVNSEIITEQEVDTKNITESQEDTVFLTELQKDTEILIELLKNSGIVGDLKEKVQESGNSAEQINTDSLIVAVQQEYAEIANEPVDAEIATEQVVAEIATEQVDAEIESEQVVAEIATEQVDAEIATEQVVAEIATEQVDAEIATEQVDAEIATKHIVAEIDTEQVDAEIATEQVDDAVAAEHQEDDVIVTELHNDTEVVAELQELVEERDDVPSQLISTDNLIVAEQRESGVTDPEVEKEINMVKLQRNICIVSETLKYDDLVAELKDIDDGIVSETSNIEVKTLKQHDAIISEMQDRAAEVKESNTETIDEQVNGVFIVHDVDRHFLGGGIVAELQDDSGIEAEVQRNDKIVTKLQEDMTEMQGDHGIIAELNEDVSIITEVLQENSDIVTDVQKTVAIAVELQTNIKIVTEKYESNGAVVIELKEATPPEIEAKLQVDNCIAIAAVAERQESDSIAAELLHDVEIVNKLESANYNSVEVKEIDNIATCGIEDYAGCVAEIQEGDGDVEAVVLDIQEIGDIAIVAELDTKIIQQQKDCIVESGDNSIGAELQENDDIIVAKLKEIHVVQEQNLQPQLKQLILPEESNVDDLMINSNWQKKTVWAQLMENIENHIMSGNDAGFVFNLPHPLQARKLEDAQLKYFSWMYYNETLGSLPPLPGMNGNW